MAKRCLIVSYYFPPTGGGGVQRITKWIKYLSRSNWRFTVITADEQNLLIPRDESLKTEIPRQTRLVSLKNINPALALKNPAGKPGINKSSYFMRWLSAFFYLPDMRKNWLAHLKPVLLKELETNHYDCLLFTIPPYSLALLAAEMVKLTNVPVVLDLRDPWSTNPYKIHPTIMHRLVDRRLELRAVAEIPNIISAYRNLLDYYAENINGFNEKNTALIANGFDEDDFIQLQAEEQDGAFFNIAFSGTLYSHLNNPTPLFAAMARLKKKYPDRGSRIRFHHLGKAMIDLKKLARRYSLEEQLLEWGYLSHKKALEKLNGMDALCFILDDAHKNAANTIGGKVYEYLRLKKPILALVPREGEAARLIRYTDSGKVISPSDRAFIAKTLGQWQENPPHYGFKNIEDFNRERQAQQLGRFLEQLIPTR